MNVLLTSGDKLTELVRSKGVQTWEELLDYVQHIPYGRTKNKLDFGAVIRQNKGTCSTKHALLWEIAQANGIGEVTLVIGLYRMSEENTPGIGKVLVNQGLSYLPEAHCYLILDGQRRDFTSPSADITKVASALIEEVPIKSQEIGPFKESYHRKALQKWLTASELDFTLEEIWTIREACILNLSS